MGIFDPSSGADPRRPIGLVSRYQSAMQRAAYSPSVAQAAARSGVNPTLATRIAAREVAQQQNSALPGLISQEAQMMEARRLENDQKERAMAGLGLNVAGQVVGTALSAYGGGGGGQGGGAGVGAVSGVGNSLLGSYMNQGSQNSNQRRVPMAPQMAQQQILSAPPQQVSATAVESSATPQPSGGGMVQNYLGPSGLQGFGNTQYQNGVPVFNAPANTSRRTRRVR